jgi:hypothetical protein
VHRLETQIRSASVGMTSCERIPTLRFPAVGMTTWEERCRDGTLSKEHKTLDTRTELIGREKAFHLADIVGDAVGWQALQKDLAVALALDSRVEQHQHAAILQ